MVRVNKKERIKKRSRLKILGLIFLLAFLLILGGVVFKISRSAVKSVWDGQSQLNLAINPSRAGQPVLIVGFNPEEKSLNILSIPAGTFIETIHGYGPYRVESLYRLGELNKKGQELFRGSLETYLGVPIEAYALTINGDEKTEGMKNKEGITRFLKSLLKRGQTNLTKWDLLRLWLGFKNLRQDRINLIDLGQTSASQEVDLPDGTKAKKIDTERLQSIMNKFFVDKKIKQEDLTVAVLNGTNHAGLANQAATLIKNIGSQIVAIGETENKLKYKECQVMVEKKYKNSYTIQKLSYLFDCHWQGESMAGQRADVVLILGESYWEKLALP